MSISATTKTKRNIMNKVSQIRIFYSLIKKGLVPYKPDLLKYKKDLLLYTKKPTGNRHDEFSRQTATANSCSKLPQRNLAANFHGK